MNELIRERDMVVPIVPIVAGRMRRPRTQIPSD